LWIVVEGAFLRDITSKDGRWTIFGGWAANDRRDDHH
jgi:hypothetical protein